MAMERKIDEVEETAALCDGDVEEDLVKIKRKRRKQEKMEEQLQDPLELFGRDIMMMIFKILDARSVALSLLVSRTWYDVASSDTLWSPKVTSLLVYLFDFLFYQSFLFWLLID